MNLPQQIQLKHLMCSFYCENAIGSFGNLLCNCLLVVYDWDEVQCVGTI
jgi:hypothetical protein